jgi:small GTP-binding protein
MLQPVGFEFDVFLSYSAKDKEVVREIAQRLRQGGLRVWFDESDIKSGGSIWDKVEYGLEHSRGLVLCMSANAFGPEWAQLEAGTFRFRDPLNTERYFIPLRLDRTPVTGSLVQILHIDWLPQEREQAYAKLLGACPPAAKLSKAEATRTQSAEKVINFAYRANIFSYAFSSDGNRVFTGAEDSSVRLWDVATGRCLHVFEGHTSLVGSVAWSADQRYVLSASDDSTIRLWDIKGHCLHVLKGHHDKVLSVVWNGDQRRALSGSGDATVRLWDIETGSCLRVFEGHMAGVGSVAWNSDQRRALSGSIDGTLRLWDVNTGRCLRVLEGHTAGVWSVAWNADRRRALSGSDDQTVRLWDVETGRCLRVLEGHSDKVWKVVWNNDQRHALSASYFLGGNLRLWDAQTGRCVLVLEGHNRGIREVAWSADRGRALSGDGRGGIRVWDLSKIFTDSRGSESFTPTSPSAPDQVQYTNVKVLLVGESGAGKTGLSKRIALNEWEPSDSTVGAWATHWKLPVSSDEGVDREIWLWDFGGQADQRLIHQLYMDETSLVALVFDGQKEDLFETLGQWDRDLTRASNKEFSKLLVAGRVDAGGLRVSRNQLENFAKERGFLGPLETSAKVGTGCAELKDAILKGIKWENIPWRTSPLLFKLLKEEIIRLKDTGRVLMRFNELRETLQIRLSGEVARFTDEELKAVIGLLAGPGVVWELKFGSWILLQPERINAYAQAVIQTMRADQNERGCITEERVLNGDLTYYSSVERLAADEERFVLLAMHQVLVERGLCLREHTDQGALLIFPSYYRRERPELVGHPAVFVSYRFNGFLDDIYATLVVRLHHTKPFEQDQLWRYAADFRTLTNRQLGVKMTRRAEGAGELAVYFDPAIPVEEKIIFSKYVHEHLLQSGRDVLRLRYYVCPHCGTPVENREVAMKRLDNWLSTRPGGSVTGRIQARLDTTGAPTIICSECEKRVPLWDEMEQCFASPEIQQRVRDLRDESTIVLDNESKERALVGDVISTVALAGQISREFNVSDHGIDMEIEFKSDTGTATGRKVYLQLKSGDSYIARRKSDGAKIFRIKKARHADYWRDQAFPVLLVTRNSEGEIRWMDVRAYLKRESDDGKKLLNEIVFEGRRFDVMSVRRWRDRSLAIPPSTSML